MKFLSVACALCALWSVCARADTAATTLTVQGGGAGGAAWAAGAELLAWALRAEGGRADVAPPPPCAAPPDSPLCLAGALAGLRRGGRGVRVALALPVAAGAAGPLAQRLRDEGLADLGDAAPPARRACVSLADIQPRLTELHQLADPVVAAAYAVPPDTLQAMLQNVTNFNDTQSGCSSSQPCRYSPEWCSVAGAGAPCAHIAVQSAGELHVLRAVVLELRLRAHVCVLPAGVAVPPVVVCGWEWSLPPGPALIPPPCSPGANLTERDAECPFEARRFVKLAHEVTLAREARAARVLARFWLEARELRALGAAGAEVARWAAALGGRWAAGAARGARVAVMVSASGARGAAGGLSLAAAAALAQEHLESDAPLKVQVSDAGCSAARALRVATDALGGGEYGALSALAGPPCAAALRATAQLSAAFRLPVLALAPAAPAPGGWALLAAGEARQAALAARALLHAQGWRRVAALSAGAPLHAALQGADVLLHVDLPERDDDTLDTDLIDQWAVRAAALDARILLVGVEDTRALHAALCAGARAGLRPQRGVVWVVLGAAPRALADLPPCARDAADHMLLVQWDWTTPAPLPRAWRAGVARHCALLAGAGEDTVPDSACTPDARAALLYDTLVVWARALRRLRAETPAAADDLHDPDVARKLIEYATTMNYTGLTGPFEWEDASEEVVSAFPSARLGATRARRAALRLGQWRAGAERAVARWERGHLTTVGAPRWLTADGRAPGDGRAECALAGLADVLGSCTAALGAVAALALGALLTALGGAALYGKRRLERRFRARLAALARAPPHRTPDRWELPRPHVVINRRLGVGAFGAVYGGHARLDASAEGWTAVAVKMLRPGASTDEKLDFLAEAEAMKRLEHPNVVRLLGVVTQSEPVCCVMEFLLYGDLKGYLLARRHLAVEGGEGAADVSPARLTSFARDAARALSYLAARRVLHRDVAARNCLVSARGTVKLADFGMARCVFERDYYRFGRRGLLPVRWMSPEALARGVFSPASDVWSLAVLLLEIVTFGALPYAPLTNRQVLARVCAGGAPDLPPGVAPPLAGLLRACWAASPAARPGAAEVAAWLAEGERLLTPCLAAPPLEPAGPAEGGAGGWWSGSAGTDCTYLSDAPPHEPLLP